MDLENRDIETTTDNDDKKTNEDMIDDLSYNVYQNIVIMVNTFRDIVNSLDKMVQLCKF